MQVTARLNNLKIAPRKVRLVTHSISGMPVRDALAELSKQVKRSSEPIEKLLLSAIANAEHNFGLDPENLYVHTIFVGDGPRLKRWQPRAFGRANPIIRRLSKVTLTLEETIEGFNRKERKHDAPKEAVVPENTEKEEKDSLLKSDERKEAKKEVAVKQEMKERKNAVKRVYQRKSF